MAFSVELADALCFRKDRLHFFNALFDIQVHTVETWLYSPGQTLIGCPFSYPFISILLTVMADMPESGGFFNSSNVLYCPDFAPESPARSEKAEKFDLVYSKMVFRIVKYYEQCWSGIRLVSFRW
ncbi:MAG: hypothetical protein PVJ86_12780 [Phycisphaerales bacterium]